MLEIPLTKDPNRSLTLDYTKGVLHFKKTSENLLLLIQAVFQG